MSRRLSQQFNCRALADLTRQLLVAPKGKRIEQVRRAERLHDELDAARNYPFDFINYRITGYHSESEDAVLVGEAVLPDLRLMIDSLSRSVGMPRRAGGPMVLAAELAATLNVSTKTVERWRRIGLRWRWVEPERAGGRKQVVFTREAVDHFLERHADRVDRARRFSKMSDHQRAELLERARQLASDPDMSHFRTARRLARETGRAIETIRLLLEQHDREHPDNKVFTDHTGPLTSRQKQVIARAHRMGVPIDRITGRFRRSKATIQRIIRQRRAADLKSRRIDSVASPTFARKDADEVLLRPEPPPPQTPPPVVGLDTALASVPEELRVIYDQRSMHAERIESLVVRMNYLKFKAAKLCHDLHRYDPTEKDLNLVEAYLEQAAAIRDRLVRANLSHVLVVARQHQSGQEEESNTRLTDLLEIGNDELFRAIDTYDAAHGQTLESYLTWLLKRRYASHQARSTRARRRLTGTMVVDHLLENAARSGVSLRESEVENPESGVHSPEPGDG